MTCNIQVPLSVIVAWIIGINMDLDLNLLETSALALSILVTAFTLQVQNNKHCCSKKTGDDSYLHFFVLNYA